MFPACNLGPIEVSKVSIAERASLRMCPALPGRS